MHDASIVYDEGMRTTVSVAEPLLESAKRQAKSRGTTLSAVVEDALRSHLAESPRRKPEPFKLYTVRGKLVDPDLDLDKTSALVMNDDAEAYRPR
jgi:hypothetical protein